MKAEKVFVLFGRARCVRAVYCVRLVCGVLWSTIERAAKKQHLSFETVKGDLLSQYLRRPHVIPGRK